MVLVRNGCDGSIRNGIEILGNRTRRIYLNVQLHSNCWKGKFHTFSMKFQHKFSWPKCLFYVEKKQLFNYSQRRHVGNESFQIYSSTYRIFRKFSPPRWCTENFQTRWNQSGTTTVPRVCQNFFQQNLSRMSVTARSQSTWCKCRVAHFLQYSNDAKMSCDLTMAKMSSPTQRVDIVQE